MIQLESVEHDYIRSLKSQSYEEMSTLSRKDSVGLGIRGYGFFFSFSRSKASDANIGIIAILVHFEKTLIVQW